MTAMAVDVDRLWLSLRTTGAEGVCRSVHPARWDDVGPAPCVDCTSVAADVVTALLESPRFNIGWADDPEPFIKPVRFAEDVAATSEQTTTEQARPEPSRGSARPRATPGTSKKVAAARASWAQILAAQEFVPSLKANVALRDATYAQVIEMAENRARQAHHNTAVAERLEDLARSMKALGAQTAGDLPEDLVLRTFGAGGDDA